MKKFIFAKKRGMTSFFTENGNVVGVTVLEYQDTHVYQGAHSNDSFFNGLVVGGVPLKETKCSASKRGFFKKHNTSPVKYLEAIPLSLDDSDQSLLGLDQFGEGDNVNVSAISSGKGFAGTIKRHNFRRGNKTHGSKSYRQPGSIGGGTTPGRVLPGKKMAGRLGSQKVTIKNLSIVFIDNEKGLLFIKGSIPGKKNGLVQLFQ